MDMIVQALAFYLFAGVAVASGIMVISARNPVHSVLFLILAFFNAAALFVLMGAEFLAMILVVVYVGAVAVLFLFVVMMLDISLSDLRQGVLQYLPVGGMIGLVLLAELVLVFGAWTVSATVGDSARAPTPSPDVITNTEALGLILYTEYAYLFQGAGLILLVAMIGAIVLTLRQRPGTRRQNVGDQLSRTREQSISIRKVKSGGGVQ
jgi:NADH-quinone oxidoreductase subunit J